MAMKRFIDITDFTREELRETLNQISFVKENSSVYSNELKGKTVINAFFEDNQFNESAFSAVTARMGGVPIHYNETEGVPLRDMVMQMSAVGDAIVLSHKKRGAARAASMYATIPVINAGDGKRAFPVRTLADLSTIWMEKRHVSNMKIGFLGDFSDNAMVRNLLQCLNLYNGNEFFFISVNGKPLGEEYVALMDKRDKQFVVYDNLFEILPELDVLYMTEVNKTSFESEIMYESRKHNFTLDERLLLTAKPDLLIMHPFPRGEELSTTVDGDVRAKYFKAFNYFNDACLISLIKTISGKPGRNITPVIEEATHDFCCGKDNCITSTEKYLPSLFYETKDGKLLCKYCMQELKADER